jgi:hypothetical protein
LVGIDAIFSQFTPFSPWTTRENPTVAPTMLCVVETGSDNIVAITNQTQDPENQNAH